MRSKFVLIPALMAIFFAIEMFLISPTKLTSAVSTPPTVVSNPTRTLSNQSLPTSPTKNTLTTPSDPYTDQLQAITQLDEHPDVTQEKLKKLARKMSDQELQALQKKALNTQLSGDDRWFAMYILSLAEQKSTNALLEEVALSPTPNQQQDLRMEFEKTLRAQAIEGLQNQPDKKRATASLQRLTQKLDDHFLLDRAQRALSHLENGTPSLEEQDRKALEKLVQ